MNTIAFVLLIISAVNELVRYDVRRLMGRASVCPAACGVLRQRSFVNDVEICRAINIACGLYVKQVMCLQRSMCLVRLMRANGMYGRLVIGYRPTPFVAHAWVELEDRVINDSQSYHERMVILYTA